MRAPSKQPHKKFKKITSKRQFNQRGNHTTIVHFCFKSFFIWLTIWKMVFQKRKKIRSWNTQFAFVSTLSGFPCDKCKFSFCVKERVYLQIIEIIHLNHTFESDTNRISFLSSTIAIPPFGLVQLSYVKLWCGKNCRCHHLVYEKLYVCMHSIPEAIYYPNWRFC